MSKVAAPPRPAAKAVAKAAPVAAAPAKVVKEKVEKVTATGEAKARGKTGATLQMSVKQTWFYLLEQNELRPTNEKWTDTDISNFMKTEFPRADGSIPTEYEPEGIARVRTYYNNGMGSGSKPEHLSFKYNERGEVMGGPRGTMGEIRKAQKEAEAAANPPATPAAKVAKAAPAPAAKATKGAPVAKAVARK